VDFLNAAIRAELQRRREEIEGDPDLIAVHLDVKFARGDAAPRVILFSKTSEKRLTHP